MKAYKIYNIEWVGPSEKVIKLPKMITFRANDKFDTTDLPKILKKKFGCDVNSYNVTTYRIAKDIEELLRICAPEGKENKDMFTSTGNLSTIGKRSKNYLENQIYRRLMMENEGHSQYKMPKILDEIMLGIENITNSQWGKRTQREIMSDINKQITYYKTVYSDTTKI